MSDRRPSPWWVSSILAPILVAGALGLGSWAMLSAKLQASVDEHERRLGVLEADIKERATAKEVADLRTDLKAMDAKLTQILLILSSGRPK